MKYGNSNAFNYVIFYPKLLQILMSVTRVYELNAMQCKDIHIGKKRIKARENQKQTNTMETRANVLPS
jgi:hypothetical protein